MNKFYKALHNLSIGGTLFEEGKIYSEKDVTDCVDEADIPSDFVEVTSEQIEENELRVNKPKDQTGEKETPAPKVPDEKQPEPSKDGNNDAENKNKKSASWPFNGKK